MLSIFLYDTVTNEYAELETENIDLETVFSVSDIADISSRKDVITKSITFKGTSNNNIAFGNLFHLNRYTNPTSSAKLYSSYSPIKRVDCLVYEDSMLLINGELLITGINVGTDGNIFYESYITGKFIGFKGELADKLLTDLDFTDLKHRYYAPHIVDSWGGYIAPGSDPNSVGLSRTQRYDTETDTYYYMPFEYGSGYIYPYIDYGKTFKNPDFNQSYTYLHLHNYRAAVWVREYFNRIIGGAGFTYEIKGSPDFLSLFNKLIVPHAADKLTIKGTSNRAIYSLASAIDTNFNRGAITTTLMAHPVKFANQDNTYLTDWSTPWGDSTTPADREKNILVVKRNFFSDARVTCSGWYTGNNPGTEIFSIQLCRRNFTTSTNINSLETQFEVIGEQSFQCANDETIDFSADFIIPVRDYSTSEQLQVRLLHTNFSGIGWGSFEIQSASLELSKNSSTEFEAEVNGNTDTVDIITPSPPEGIRQFDFIKSVISLLNLYCYTKKDLPKHLIFEQYDYFYASAQPTTLTSYSNDWTPKIDFASGFKYTANNSIPKKYQFTFKDDSDYINQYYTDRYAETYGVLKFEDSLGFVEEKKLELIFSPSPMVSIPGTYKYHPAITQNNITLAEKKPTKSNIRILVYNGVHACNYEQWSIDKLESDGEFGIDFITGWNFYANCSNYLFSSSTDNFHTPRDIDGKPNAPIPMLDLHFSHPKEYYFNATSTYNTLPTSYSYYINQLTELTNANLFSIECRIFLSEIDIARLDFKKPVFLDLGKLGHGYFKVLNVVYANNKTTSAITLQKII